MGEENHGFPVVNGWHRRMMMASYANRREQVI